MKKPLDALVLGIERGEQLSTLIRVAQELVDRLLQRILNTRALELGHHQRDAVHEQHRVGDHMPAPAAQLHLELVDDQEVVVRRILEVDEFHRLRSTVVPIRQALRHGTLQQELRGGLVYFHQAVPRCLFQIPDSAGDTCVIEPWLAVAWVELTQGRCQPFLQQIPRGSSPAR